jgi:hypothetical protein
LRPCCLIKRQIAEAAHLFAVVLHYAINLDRRQHFLPLSGAPFSKEALIGCRRALTNAARS